MERFLPNLATASIHGSIVILAVILFRLLLQKTPKKYICLLWLLAGIRLLLPIEIHSDLSLQPKLTLPAGLLPLSLTPILLWVWGAVALGFCLYSLISYLRLKARVREAVRIRGGWESDRIDTAFILGLIRPRIYIPMGMTRRAQKHILEHERTHLDKGDHWIKMIGFLALALHWFNPLVWVAYILLCKDIEMACDERVVRFMELEERKSYSAALLSCSGRQMRLSANPVAFGEVSVKKRILNVLNYKKPSFWFSLLGVAAFFFAAVCLLTSPENDVLTAVPLSPQEQAQQALIQKCQEDVEAAFAKDEFSYELIFSNAGTHQYDVAEIYKQSENTMWTFFPHSRNSITEGQLMLDGVRYAWQSGSWVKTDAPDDRMEAWRAIFRWDPNRTEFVSESTDEGCSSLTFTFCWDGADRTVHTATAEANRDSEGNLLSLNIRQPNYETCDEVRLLVVPPAFPVRPDDPFAEAKAAVTEGFVTADELADQEEFAKWDVFFRVDDDRLSGRGSDVSFSQGMNGLGVISTTEAYWLEQRVDGKWVRLSPISEPMWKDDGIGVAKETATYGYLDWYPIYGELEPGQYRMGKRFRCYDMETRYSREHDFYAEFTINQSVDAASPEAKDAVERCYAALEALKGRQSLHWISIAGKDSYQECWINGKNSLDISQWGLPDEPFNEEQLAYEKTLFPRVDTFARYDGVQCTTARKDPNVLSSEAIGMELTYVHADPAAAMAKAFAEDFNIGFFTRDNHTITFPEGIGVISDEMVRFCKTWKLAGLPNDEFSAQLTYRFDPEGNLCYMAYETDLDTDHPYCSSIEIFPETAEEIDAIIKPYTENLVISDFSWEEAQRKYIGTGFNIRQDSFACNGGSTVGDPVTAARLALKEYPNLEGYLDLRVCRDSAAGMWKVTLRSYVDYQATYAYRDIYLSDSGATQLLVYEGPVRFDEARK